jgi:hypothetical protein
MLEPQFQTHSLKYKPVLARYWFLVTPGGQGIFLKTICEAWRAWALEIF